jgi:hypothetical protein
MPCGAHVPIEGAARGGGCGKAREVTVLVLAPWPPSPPPQNESYGDKVSRTRHNTENINSFWKVKRNAKEMDEVYTSLLRSGKGTVTRHYELTGTLAAAEASQNPQYSHMQAILAVPPPPDGAGTGTAAGAGAAAAPAAAPAVAPPVKPAAATGAPSAPAGRLAAGAPAPAGAGASTKAP